VAKNFIVEKLSSFLFLKKFYSTSKHLLCYRAKLSQEVDRKLSKKKKAAFSASGLGGILKKKKEK
jgi:hypothetical protein